MTTGDGENQIHPDKFKKCGGDVAIVVGGLTKGLVDAVGVAEFKGGHFPKVIRKRARQGLGAVVVVFVDVGRAVVARSANFDKARVGKRGTKNTGKYGYK